MIFRLKAEATGIDNGILFRLKAEATGVDTTYCSGDSLPESISTD
jgi:hypothetical protein